MNSVFTNADYSISSVSLVTHTVKSSRSVVTCTIRAAIINSIDTFINICIHDSVIIISCGYSRCIPSHVVPSPLYPWLHVQLKLPGVLVHVALESQSLVAALAHSSISDRMMIFE